MNIILGVSASIAIYKSCEIVRLLRKSEIGVRVVMTPTASQWISPLVFSALSDYPVYVLDTDHGSTMAHIDLRKDVDLMLVAPASANLISQAANGSAHTLLSALLLSYSGAKWVAPSMNPAMYVNPAVQKNLQTLNDFGYKIIKPDNGEALCGDTGEGKMAPVEQIISEIQDFRKTL